MSSGSELLKPDSRMVSLHVGDSGSGKTCAAACYPKPVYIFDIDNRVAGLRGYRPALEWLANNQIDYDRYPMTAEGLEKLDVQLEKFVNQGWKMKYKTLVFDTVTSLERMTIKYAEKWVNSPAQKFGKFTVPSYTEWGIQLKAFDKFLAEAIPALPCNVVVGAHWADEYEASEPGKPATIKVGKKINVRPKLADMVPTYFNEIFFFEKRVGRVFNEETKKTEEGVTFDCVTRNELARTTYLTVPNRFEWTNKNFYEILMGHLPAETRDAIAANLDKITV